MTEEAARKPVPKRECISCGKLLQAEQFVELEEGQADLASPVYDGIYLAFRSGGNYGSTVFDMNDYGVEGYLCDECFLQKADRLYTWERGRGGRERIGTRLSEHEDYKDTRLEKYGPAWLSKYSNGEHWVEGIRLYREITSEQRSEGERLLMESEEDTLTVPRELLDGLLGALRAAEHNAMEREVETRRALRENDVLKEQLAGEPREAETLAILHKEASELSVSELQRIREYARWAMKIQGWMHEHPLFFEDGKPLDSLRLWVELTEGSKGLREYEEREKVFHELLKAKLAEAGET